MTESEPEIVAVPEAAFEELDVDAPLVGIIMGSKSDLPAMEKAEQELNERGIRCEVRVMSAHREPDKVAEYARNAKMRGLRVIIAGAGLSAALHRCAADQPDLRGRWSRRAVVDRPDAARRARGLRWGRQRPQRRRAGGADTCRLTFGPRRAGALASGPATDDRHCRSRLLARREPLARLRR